MKRWWRRLSIRLRITLLFAVSLTAILTLYSGGVYLWLRHNLISTVDKQLHEDFEASEDRLKLLPGGKIVWSGSYEHGDEDEEKESPKWIDVWKSNGELLYSNKPGNIKAQAFPNSCVSQDEFHYLTRTISGFGNVRALCKAHPIDSLPTIIRVTRSLENVDENLEALLLIIAIALPIAIGASALGGYALAHRALAPLGKMVNRAKTITADRLTDRLPVENPHDELGHLAATFNETFARLEQSFDQMRRFSSDASHELRTPLTALRSVGEVYLRGGQKNGIETVVSMLEESHRMQQLIESLLTLSRADAGQIQKKATKEDVSGVVKDVIRHLEVLAEEKQQTFRFKTDSDTYASVDATLLRQAIINLVDNAIKYSPKRSVIDVSVRKKADKLLLEVEDSGPGIAKEHWPRLFDRFYRVDKSRSRELGGFGLGLSIAKWAVEINGGNLDVESEEGRGTVFRITLPSSEVRPNA